MYKNLAQKEKENTQNNRNHREMKAILGNLIINNLRTTHKKKYIFLLKRFAYIRKTLYLCS